MTGYRYCEEGCGCRYGTEDPDWHECACDGPCTSADWDTWWGEPPGPTMDDLPTAPRQHAGPCYRSVIGAMIHGPGCTCDTGEAP